MPQEEINSRDFIMKRRPKLAKITEYPKMEFADYERRLTSLQGVLQLIQQAYLGTSERALLVLEGWDTAGKGGLVRRLGWALDPRSFKVHPIAAPDRARARPALPPALLAALADKGTNRCVRPFLVRPRAGGAHRRHRDQKRNGGAPIARSTTSNCMLIDSGIRLVKLFLHITPDEQMRRFRDRLFDPVKRWKLSYEDFRNRMGGAERYKST